MVIPINNRDKYIIFVGIVIDGSGHDRKRTVYETNPSLYEPPVRQGDGRIRRCGKSVVLQLIAEELERQGVPESRSSI